MKKRGSVKASVEMYKEAAEVGSRLRCMRENEGLSQSGAAEELTITRERLANYEDGRTPLPVLVGLRACCQFIYSEKWLATGEGDPRMLMNLGGDSIVDHIRIKVFYGTSYKEGLSARYEELFSSNTVGARLPRLGYNLKYDSRVFQNFMFEWYRLLGADILPSLLYHLLDEAESFCADNINPKHLANPDFLTPPVDTISMAFVGEKIRKAHARAMARKWKKKPKA